MQDNTASIDTQQSDSLRNIVLGCYAASLLGPFISIGMLNVPVMLVAWFYSSRARDTAYEDHLKQLIQTPLICLVLMVVVIFTRILAVPNWALVPVIAIITAIGVYAVHATTFDLFLMIAIGIFGYILRKLDFPLSPLLLGFILGGLMEQNLRRALSISNGALEILWSSPITFGVWVLTAIMLLVPLLRIWRKRVQQRRALADV